MLTLGERYSDIARLLINLHDLYAGDDKVALLTVFIIIVIIIIIIIITIINSLFKISNVYLAIYN